MTQGDLSIAVTGAAGYNGSRVVERLRTAHPDWSITALDNFYRGDVRQIGDVEVQRVDIRHRSELDAALEGSDVVMHLAALSGVEDSMMNPDLAYEVNVTGTNNVAWFCKKTGTGLVFPISMAILGDPDSFPITVDDGRDPMNWYGRTKLLNERTIETLAPGSFPAHLFLISNLYGEHEIGDRRVSKEMVINFFVNRAIENEPLTVYRPGTQARNYVHVDDVAGAYVRSAERIAEQRTAGETGVERYDIASDEDPSVIQVAETVKHHAREELGREVEIKLVDNPRSGETLVEEFAVDTSLARDRLGWEPEHTVDASVRTLLRANADAVRTGERVDQPTR